MSENVNQPHPTHIAVYGTLRQGCWGHGDLPYLSGDPVSVERIHGFKLMARPDHRLASGAPVVLKTDDSADSIVVELHPVNGQQLAKTDRYEGIDRQGWHYYGEVVQTSVGPARLYVAKREGPDDRPVPHGDWTPYEKAGRSPLLTLEAFQQAVKELGGETEDPMDDRPYMKFPREHPEFSVSPPSGGCESPGCRCSPGLWITMFSKTHHVTAHFGKDWKRGGEGTFTERDFDAWRTLKRRVEATQAYLEREGSAE